MSKGWISLHRSIQDHWLYEKRIFSKFEAWVDLLMMANHKPNKFLLGNELMDLDRGQLITSELKLMEKWGWSKTKVRNFLKILEEDGMILKKSDKKKTTLTICNYSTYQRLETTEKPQENHEETTEEPQEDTNNNDNNANNSIKDIVDYLNKVTGKKFKHTTSKTKTCINARLKEGFEINDFKKVIDSKSKEWLKNPSMEKYLRPETLFGTKFDGYLNEGGVPGEGARRHYEINRAPMPTIEEGDDPIF